MMDRLKHRGKIADKELLFEEAAVLAGTMLMGSGISGSRPNAHDSTVGLPTLVQKIADYRDAFYQQLLAGVDGEHAERLEARSGGRLNSLSAARGSTSIIIWPSAAPNNCSTCTWRSFLPAWDTSRRPGARFAWCPWPRRGCSATCNAA